MLNIGFFELTLFGIIALIVLGPEKLPTAARTVGKWYGTIRRASQRLQTEISQELQILETQAELKAELARIKESEAKMKEQMTALQNSLKNTQPTQQTPPKLPETDKPDSAQETEVPALAQRLMTAPLTNRWFLLGDYDRRRRLPPAPFLPNYAADPLLFQQVTHG